MRLLFSPASRVVQQLVEKLIAGAEVGLAQASERDCEIREAML